MITKKLFIPLIVSVAGAAFLATSPVLANPIYVFRENDGTIRFTNKQPEGVKRVDVFTARSGSYARYSVSPIRSIYSPYGMNKSYDTKKYEAMIKRAANLHQVDTALIKAVIHAESSFNPRAVSPKGAMGLMQLMPAKARELGVRAFDAEDNIHGGTQFLASLIKRFGGNLAYAIAAYNAGEGAVEKYRGIPPYYETMNYVKKVLALKTRYSTGYQPQVKLSSLKLPLSKG